MFTGLIRELAEVDSLHDSSLKIRANHTPKIGDSIAINGACLTVVSLFDGGFEVELSEETRRKVATQNYHGRVHMEPAMRLQDRLEGHIVQGHIDGIGTLTKIQKHPMGSDFFIEAPSEVLRYIIPKGSVAIDGVSLTVNEVLSDSFRLTLIPHTLTSTLFGDYSIGRKVNIETDILVRSIAHLLGKRDSLSWAEVDSILMSY